jgi:hypothetical protein
MMTQVRFLEKGEDSLKWGDIYQMFKKQNFVVDVKDQDELRIFKNIKKYGIHRVATVLWYFPVSMSFPGSLNM